MTNEAIQAARNVVERAREVYEHEDDLGELGELLARAICEFDRLWNTDWVRVSQ